MPGFRATPDLRLVGIDVTSQPFARRTRQLVRRYHISYVSEGNRYYLTKYEMEGRCAAVDELADGSLPDTMCRRLPATRLRYSQRERATMAGKIILPSAPLHAQGKPISVTVLDVNGDSLPDFIETKETNPPLSSQRLYLNGDWNFAPPVVMNGLDRLFSRIGSTVTGSVNIVTNGPAAALWHAPGFIPEIFTASQSADGAWSWSGAPPVSIFESTSLLPVSVVGDLDGDGLADSVFFRDVFSTVPSSFGEPTAVSLGAFAHPPLWTSSLHVQSCFGPSPQRVTSMDWDSRDASASLVDMNGDSLGDLAFITKEKKSDGRVFLGVRYWPGDGRGNFTACTSDTCQCTENGFETPSVAFESFEITPVVAAQISPNNVALADVNGDGFADLIVVTPETLLHGSAGLEARAG
jgi:hypothetical protein